LFTSLITEERMSGNPTRGRKIKMIHAKDDGYATPKRAAEDRRIETRRKYAKNLLYSRRISTMIVILLANIRKLHLCSRNKIK